MQKGLWEYWEPPSSPTSALGAGKDEFGIVDDLRICESVRASLHIKVTSELLCQQRESHLAPG